jgi:hypothetical protein
MPQLNLVPVSPSQSRITQSSGVSGATSTECLAPFTVSSIAITFLANRLFLERVTAMIDNAGRNPDPDSERCALPSLSIDLRLSLTE